ALRIAAWVRDARPPHDPRANRGHQRGRQGQGRLLLRLDAPRARRDRALLPYPLGARTMEPEMGPAPVVPGKQVRPLACNADPGASPSTPCWPGDTPPADHHDPLRCFQGVACCEFRCELPLQDSNLVRGAKRPLFALQRVTARDASPCGAAFSARRVGRPTRAVVGSNPTGGSVPLTP